MAIYKKRNEVTLITVVIIFLMVMGIACSKKKVTRVSSGTRHQILHIGNGAEPQDLDPHIVTGVPEHYIISALLEGLVTEDPGDLSIKPGMAESWKISDDRITYEFNIRRNAVWSNGDPFTAEDMVYSFKRMLSPGLGGEYAYMLYYLKNAEKYHKGALDDFSKVGVSAQDKSTLIITLAHPTPFFLSLLTHFSTFPVHKATIEAFGAMDKRGGQWTRPENFVGNGPFILDRWELNKVIVVKKNPDYWDADTVKLSEIHFYPVDNISTEERMFRAGQLHVTSTIPSEKIAFYREKRPEVLRIAPYLGTYYYLFNTVKTPFNDARVRRAFAMSVDRQQIVAYITKGGQIPAYSFTPPNTAGYTPETKIPYDIDAARALLAEAGYPDGRGLPEAEILYNTSEGHRKIAVALQQMWKKALNVTVTLTNQDWKVYLSSRKTRSFTMARAGWIGDYADPNTFLDMFVTDGGNNHTGWSSPEYDALIREAGETGDRKKRYAVFQQAEKILLEEAPILPIYTYTSLTLLSPTVKGWYPNILDHHPYKYVYLEASE